MLNLLRFYIPEVFPSLKKLVFLDDDVVVQKDLTGLFTVDLKGNVNGAVETCMETFHRYHKYLNYSHPLIRSHFDPDACGWAFGMNVFDLVEWRKRNVTGIYHYWQEKNVDRTLWKLGTLPPGPLTFYGLTEPLDPNWHVLGLGYTNVDPQVLNVMWLPEEEFLELLLLLVLVFCFSCCCSVLPVPRAKEKLPSPWTICCCFSAFD